MTPPQIYYDVRRWLKDHRPQQPGYPTLDRLDAQGMGELGPLGDGAASEVLWLASAACLVMHVLRAWGIPPASTRFKHHRDGAALAIAGVLAGRTPSLQPLAAALCVGSALMIKGRTSKPSGTRPGSRRKR